jgi:hypothetical protein
MTRASLASSISLVSLVSLGSLLLLAACATDDPSSGLDDDVAATSDESFVLFDHLDLSDPADNLKALIKTRASLDPNEEAVFYFKGNIYPYVPQVNVRPRPNPPAIFEIEGVNVARAIPTATGYDLVSREVMVYKDPITKQILSCWQNPLNNKRVTVLDVANDPVNFNFPFPGTQWVPLPTLEYQGRVGISNDVILNQPNVLQPALYPDFSAGSLYQAMELFNYSTNRLELDATFIKSASSDVSWTRLGQNLPWMQMGPAPGNLVYKAYGFKVRNFDAVPALLRDYVRANYPTFEHAPAMFTAPSETSWTFFKKKFDAGQYPLTCP